METGQQMIERIRKKIETEPYPIITFTKMDWAQIIGVCDEASDVIYENELEREADLRWGAVKRLKFELGLSET